MATAQQQALIDWMNGVAAGNLKATAPVAPVVPVAPVASVAPVVMPPPEAYTPTTGADPSDRGVWDMVPVPPSSPASPTPPPAAYLPGQIITTYNDDGSVTTTTIGADGKPTTTTSGGSGGYWVYPTSPAPTPPTTPTPQNPFGGMLDQRYDLRIAQMVPTYTGAAPRKRR